MSSSDSSPTDSLTMSGDTPAARCSASDNCRCVVEPGWITSVFASPTFARCDRNVHASMKRSPARFASPLAPGLTPNDRMPPAPFGR